MGPPGVLTALLQADGETAFTALLQYTKIQDMGFCTFMESHKLYRQAEKVLANERERLYNPAQKKDF